MRIRNALRRLWRPASLGAVLIGIVSAVLGLLLRDVAAPQGEARRWASALMSAGGLLIALGLVFNLPALVCRALRPRARESAGAALNVLLVLFLAGSLAYISTRKFLTMDWRTHHRAPLHMATVELLESLESAVRATVVHRTLYFPDDREWMRVMELTEEMLRDLSTISGGQIEVETLNWDIPEQRRLVQALVEDLGTSNLPAEMFVVFQSGAEHRMVPFSALAERTGGASARIDRFQGEAAFAAAIAQLTGKPRLAHALRERMQPQRVRLIDLSIAGVKVARYVFIGAVPAMPVLVGILVWFRRRR